MYLPMKRSSAIKEAIWRCVDQVIIVNSFALRIKRKTHDLV